MTTTAQKSRSSRKPTAKKAVEVVTPTPTPTPEPTAKVATSPTYREHAEFSPALKAAKSLAKGNVDLTQPLQLITHLAWKTPGGSVGWAKGTTPNVIAYADDIAVPTGTSIPEAMSAALSAAEKAATDEPQKVALAALASVINSHH